MGKSKIKLNSQQAFQMKRFEKCSQSKWALENDATKNVYVFSKKENNLLYTMGWVVDGMNIEHWTRTWALTECDEKEETKTLT